VPATNIDDRIRAVRDRHPIDPDTVRRYLEDKGTSVSQGENRPIPISHYGRLGDRSHPFG